jgi:Permuted papain-like amidase enzyme, YaeF/YiiX, C92 family
MFRKFSKSLLVAVSFIGLCSFQTCTPSIEKQKTSQEQPLDLSDLRAGDIVFQQSVSPQCQAIKSATGSDWTHVGIVLENSGKLVVLEAVEPVRVTSLEDWFARSKVNAAKRLVNAESLLTPDVLVQMNSLGENWVNRHYDIGFGWTDDELYCSELVYKLYDRVLNVQIGQIKQLKDYDLNSPIVKKIMKQRYGEAIPYEEWMIAPGAMYDSALLESVGAN